MGFASEAKFSRKTPPDNQLLTWTQRHAAMLISHHRFGSEGRTPEQRRTGEGRLKPTSQLTKRVADWSFKLQPTLQSEEKVRNCEDSTLV